MRAGRMRMLKRMVAFGDDVVGVGLLLGVWDRDGLMSVMRLGRLWWATSLLL